MHRDEKLTLAAIILGLTWDTLERNEILRDSSCPSSYFSLTDFKAKRIVRILKEGIYGLPLLLCGDKRNSSASARFLSLTPAGRDLREGLPLIFARVCIFFRGSVCDALVQIRMLTPSFQALYSSSLAHRSCRKLSILFFIKLTAFPQYGMCAWALTSVLVFKILATLVKRQGFELMRDAWTKFMEASSALRPEQ